jgi:4-hydroxysphinganine ceramide fatty acyl 2-hydroxylase
MSLASPPSPPPELLLKDVRSRNTEQSCYVTLGQKVYDVTSFLDAHPGGGVVILEWGGKDVRQIMGEQEWHVHTGSAYEILDECFIGYVTDEDTISEAVVSSHSDGVMPVPEHRADEPVFKATGMSSAEDLSRETDPDADYTQHKFLDLNKPLLMQVFNGGFSKEFYLEQVHRPRHYRGGASAPLFGNFLEPLSLTPWWVVPLMWLPPVLFGTWYTTQELGVQSVGYWIFGLGFWTIAEYALHRFLFHIDEYVPPCPPSNLSIQRETNTACAVLCPTIALA